MPNIQKLQAAVKKAGGSMTRHHGGRMTHWWIDAPEGKVWSAASVHALCMTYHNGDAADKDAAIADALGRVALGVCDCGDPECDTCHG